MFTGKVINKENNKPLYHVQVSDGRNITYTDKDGKYTLPSFERCRLVNVNILTKYENDWFYYVGTKDFEKSQNEEIEVNFSISPVKTDNDNFCFYHVSDTEIADRQDVTWAPFMKENVEKSKAAFFVNTGDLHGVSGVTRHINIQNHDTMGCPVRYAIGNHDYLGEKYGYEYGEKLYETIYGPTWYSFDYGQIHFVVLAIDCGSNHSGYERDDQYIWLKKDLELMDKSKKLIILDHTLCEDDELGFNIPCGDEVIELRKHNLLAWIFGHYHLNYMHICDGVHYACTAQPDSGGIDSCEGGIRKININGQQLTSEMVYYITPGKKSDKPIWSTKLKGQISFSKPCYEDGRIYVGTNDNGYPKDCGVFCIDESDGHIIWTYKTENGIIGALAIDDNRVFAEDTKGMLYCLNKYSGELIIKHDFEIRNPNYAKQGVLIANDSIIAGANHQICVLDKENFKLKYVTKIKYAQPCPAEIIYDEKRDQIIVVAHWRGIYAFDLASGKENWENREETSWFSASTPLLVGDEIYADGDNGLIKIDALTGKTLQNVKDEGGCIFDVGAQPVIYNGYLYYSSANCGVCKVDKDSLKIVKKLETGKSRIYTSSYLYGNIQTVESSIVIHNNEIAFAGSDGYLYFYKENGEQIRKISVGEPCLQSPIFTGKGVIAFAFDGSVKKFGI